MSGIECYTQAMTLIQSIEEHEKKLEEERAQEQYEAMMKSSQLERPDGQVTSSKIPHITNKNKNTSAGVAVVRTIARQTRDIRKKERIQEKNSALLTPTFITSATSTLQRENRAQQLMQYAGIVHGHTSALVRLGNEALKHAKEQKSEVKAFSYISTNDEEKAICNIEQMRDMSYRDRAILLYTAAGNRKSKEGLFNLGHLLWDLAEGSEDESNQQSYFWRAMNAFQEAMELGDADATFFVGVQYISLSSESSLMYEHLELSMMAEKDILFQKRHYGLTLIERAAHEYGHDNALHYLSLLYRNGDDHLGILPCSDDKFVQLLDKAADAGNPDALFLRGHCLYNGYEGYSKDYTDALKAFIQSGEAGNADGYVSAGAVYHTGEGLVEQNQHKAFELYQQAAEMGSEEAWRNLVSCYALGEGVPQCSSTADYIAKTMLGK